MAMWNSHVYTRYVYTRYVIIACSRVVIVHSELKCPIAMLDCFRVIDRVTPFEYGFYQISDDVSNNPQLAYSYERS